jgi:hypothetical protein
MQRDSPLVRGQDRTLCCARFVAVERVSGIERIGLGLDVLKHQLTSKSTAEVPGVLAMKNAMVQLTTFPLQICTVSNRERARPITPAYNVRVTYDAAESQG